MLVYVQYHYSVPGQIINVGRSHCFEGRSDNLQRNYYSLQQMENKETQSRAAERGEEPIVELRGRYREHIYLYTCVCTVYIL